MPTDEMIPLPPMPPDLIDLFAAVVDRPLFLACRATSCNVLYYAHVALDRIEDALAALSRWYDAEIPDRLWHREVAHRLDRTIIQVANARHSTYMAWRTVTDHWRDRPVPVRVSTILTGYRHRVRRARWVLGARVV